MQIDALNQIILPASLFLIMFGIGLSLQWSDFGRLLQSPKPVLIGMLGQLLLLPLIAWLVVSLLAVPGALAVGILLIALAPGGATSNLFSYLAKGDASLSIVLTGIASLVTPFTIPIVVGLAMHTYMGDQAEFSLPVVQTIVKLLFITVLPVLLGISLRARSAELALKLERGIRIFSIIFLVMIVALLTLKNRADVYQFFVVSGAATLLLNLAALIVGYMLGKGFKLSRRQAVTLSFEVGIQNGTLAMVVAGSLIGNSTMMIPAATYSLIMFFTAGLFGIWVSRKPEVNAGLALEGRGL